MLTVHTSSGDVIRHERAVDEDGQAIDTCVTCDVWPCQPVLDAEAAHDWYVARRSA